MTREDAYRLVQGHAMRSWKEGLNFHDEILADREITSKVPRKQIEHAFDLERQLKNVDKIFARVFGKKGSVQPASAKKKASTKKK
jgi:adenylosuccinate lyase